MRPQELKCKAVRRSSPQTSITPIYGKTDVDDSMCIFLIISELCKFASGAEIAKLSMKDLIRSICRTSKDGETHISECQMKGFILKSFAQGGAPQCESPFLAFKGCRYCMFLLCMAC